MRTFACYAGFLLSICFCARIHALPSGFRDEGVAFKSGATGFTFVPKVDGGSILLICQKKGEVIAIPDPDKADSKKVDVLDIEDKVCTDGERGISQIIPHPDFLKTRYVYLFYTFDKNGGCKFSDVDGPVNVVSRFTLNDDLKMVDEKIILQTSPLHSKVHNAGDMKFGNDGYLYVTLGNGGKANEHMNSQKANTLLGSIVRITEDGDIPSDNPFTDDDDRKCGNDGVTSSSSRCSEIWSIGFRNPFRFAMNPNEKDFTQFWVHDVGGATWEEISEVTSKSPGKNYGYRDMEGPCKRGSKVDCKPNEKFVDPLYYYEHNEEGDGCVAGGAFIPNGIWPSQYDNKYLFADFIFKEIYLLSKGDDGCRDCSPPRPDYQRESFKSTGDTGQPLQLTFGPYKNKQALYYSLWAPDGKYTIRRIIYEGGDDSNNKAPDAEIRVEDRVFGIKESIVFDGSESSDPDGQKLSFEWSFGDGGSSTKDIKTKSYGKEGKYDVSLTVSDENGFADKASKTIMVGRPPVPVIVSPLVNVTFAVDDVFMLIGFANDADGNFLSDLDLTWEVRQMHNTHYHPFLDQTVGNEIIVPPAPSPEDFHASTNSFLRILLTATDRNGLTSTVTRDIMPKTISLYFETDPPGLELILDGINIKTPEDTPLEVISWINHNITIDVRDQNDMVFDGWTNGISSRQSKNTVRENSNENVRTAKFVKLETATFAQETTAFEPRTKSDVSNDECNSIYEILCSDNRLGGLCKAIDAADLSRTFVEDQWTIFAPDDGAIFRSPDEFQDLLRDESSDPELLAYHLSYHFSKGKVLKKKDLPCRAGENLVPMINDMDSRTLCNDEVPTFQKGKGNSDDNLPEIIGFDIEACNGVIHILDRVLLYD